MHGFGAYYLIGLLVKTPLPELLLAVGAVVLVLRTERREKSAPVLAPVAAAAVLIVFASLGNVQIGIRHVLPVFALLAIAGGRGLAALVRDVPGPLATRVACRVVATGLAGWLFVASFAAHPEYIGYFNETVGADGDLVLLDSDLDWGQDLWRLERVLRERAVDRVHIAYFGPALLSRHALPELVPLERDVRVTGWIAISAMYRRSPGFEWLAAYQPVARAGRSIDLYFVPDPSPAPGG
jgi:hypothetical protein